MKKNPNLRVLCSCTRKRLYGKMLFLLLFCYAGTSTVLASASNLEADNFPSIFKEKNDVELTTSQQSKKTIKGRVTDESGASIPGASVVIKGTSTGVSTDLDGNFTLNVNESDILLISFVGMEAQEIPVKGKSLINVTLKDSAVGLDEVVAIGYKTVKRRKLSAAVSSIKTEDLEAIPTASLSTVLAGKAVGVQSVMRGGTPGASNGGFVIRGNTNLSESSNATGLSNPLYIIDGVPMALSDFAGYDVTQNDFLATLNPNDIESIDILKDAAATAIYGSRGANGVIIINTKRGKSGKTRVKFSASTGITFEPEKLKVYIGEAEREEKIRLFKESLTNLFGEQAWIDVRNGLEVEGYMYPSVLSDKYNPAFNNAYDFLDMFYQTGHTQQYDLSMDGGNAKNSFRISAGYYNEKGVLVGYDFSRLSLSASITSDINEKLHNDFSIRTTYMNRKGGETDNLMAFPTDPTNLPSSLFYKNEDELALLSGKLGDTYHKNKTYSITASEALNYKVFDGLSFNNQIGVTLNVGSKDYFVPSTVSNNKLSYAVASRSEALTLNMHSVLSYYKEINDHEITSLLGAEVNSDRNSFVYLEGEDGPSDYVKVIQGFKKENTLGLSDEVKSNMLSYFFNLSYGYKNRYKVEGVIRRDGSSRFGENNKWATFPSVKTYWIFTNEKWLESIKDVVSFGKFRVSYGTSGAIASDPLLQYNSLIATDNIGAGLQDLNSNKIDVKTYGGNSAIIPDYEKIANKSLSWSKTKEINYGIDLEFFNHRIYFTGDIYSKRIEDLVYTSSLPAYVGYSSIKSNLVDMNSNGWEMSITGYLFPRQNDFQWDWTLNLASNSTTIAKLGNGGRDYIKDDYAFVEGRQAFQYYTYEYLGPLQRIEDLPVNPVTGQPMKYLWGDAGLALNKQGKIFPGMPLFADVNGDYQVDGGDYGYDKKIIEDKSPEPKISGGLHTNIKYRNLSLRVQSSFAFGHYIFNSSLQQMLSSYDDPKDFFTKALYDYSDMGIDFWEKSGDSAYYPMRYISYQDGGSTRAFRKSSMFLEKGDYWSIDNITLSYNLPKSVSNKLGLSNVNVYSTLRNAYMWKKSNVPDPRLVSKTGYYNGQGYPISKTLMLGVNVQF